MKTYEKVETLLITKMSGEFGKFIEYSPGRYRVEADGKMFLAKRSHLGCHVMFKGIEAVAPTWLSAAEWVLANSAGGAVAAKIDLNTLINEWL